MMLILNPARVVVRDPKVCGGELTIRGTRVTIRAILASLAEGDRPEQIVEAFPSLCLDDIRAAIAFAAIEDVPIDRVSTG